MADTNVEFCAACGRKVALNAQFCAWCGANLGATEEQNVQQDAVTGEDVVGWASGVLSTTGGYLIECCYSQQTGRWWRTPANGRTQ